MRTFPPSHAFINFTRGPCLCLLLALCDVKAVVRHLGARTGCCRTPPQRSPRRGACQRAFRPTPVDEPLLPQGGDLYSGNAAGASSRTGEPTARTAKPSVPTLPDIHRFATVSQRFEEIQPEVPKNSLLPRSIPLMDRRRGNGYHFRTRDPSAKHSVIEGLLVITAKLESADDLICPTSPRAGKRGLTLARTFVARTAAGEADSICNDAPRQRFAGVRLRR